MAEFPELGKNCSLEACHKLDFMPFFCSTCEKYFCGEHRFDHGCPVENLDAGQLGASSEGSNKPLKPYLCSMNGCFISEIIRIDCQRCGLNFCLKHRYPDEHQCHVEDVTNGQINNDLQERIKEKMMMIIASDKSHIIEASIPSPSRKKKPMDETIRRRADQIAVMRLKSNSHNSHIPAAEQMFLFVTENEKREPVMVSKRWTIGRCLDQIAKQYSIPINNATFGTKALRLYCETNQSNPLPMSDNVEKHLKDMSNGEGPFHHSDDKNVRMSGSILARLSRCLYFHKAISSTAISTKRFSSAPDFDALAQKVQQWKEKHATDNSSVDNNEILFGDKIVEEREWMKAPLVYCDGSFDWTLRKGGIGIFWSPNDERNSHLSLTGSKLTNIRAEIQAVSLAALQACSLDFERVIIKTDSQFVVKVINSWLARWRSNEWKKADGKQIENMDDIQKLSRYTEMIKMRVEHTYGHQKYDEGKEMEENWDEMSCDERDRCGNFHSDRLSRLAINEPMMTDEDFKQKKEHIWLTAFSSMELNTTKLSLLLKTVPFSPDIGIAISQTTEIGHEIDVPTYQ
ncbi:AN1-type zinc finger protein [Dirofilaria immitis]